MTDKSPSRLWAYDIIEAWGKGEYPQKFRAGYEMACKAVNQTPRPHPDKIRKEHRAYKDD